MKQKKGIVCFVGMLLICNQYQVVSSASSADKYPFDSILSLVDLDDYSQEITNLIEKSNKIKTQTIDAEILSEIEHNIAQYSQHLSFLENATRQYQLDQDAIEEKFSTQTAELDTALKSNFDHYKREVTNLKEEWIPFFEASYEEVKNKIEITKAEQVQQQAKSAVALQKAIDDKQQLQRELEKNYKEKIEYLKNLTLNNDVQVKTEKDIERLKNIQNDQDFFKKQLKNINQELMNLENESLTKEFMDYVEKHAASWLKHLSNTKQVFKDSVRKILGENFTDAQVLYVQGFLQAQYL